MPTSRPNPGDILPPNFETLDYVNSLKVAHYYVGKEKTLANWRSTGTICPPHILVGGGIRYQRKDVASYAIDNLRQSTSQQIPSRARPR